ncbi:MAG: DUF1926 domain-containing protein [Lentisphaeria bacterium]|nr:DUF1926 domain-containing protein [Candidatus Neomarinimicrobiota bacterium]MCF7841521.1 DUF1926 domain-containing protein [Lentisphaeria bacterium]
MKSIQFIFGIHNHQPVGNFDAVMHDACDRAYQPFLETLEQFPTLQMSFHFSGSLIEWLEGNRPEVLELLDTLVRRGSVELLSAGFYEPILTMIPNRDKLGQLRKMNRYLKKRFNYDARGSWLTERVWEPHLVSPIAQSGLDYIVLDDYHFLSAGLRPEALTGYFNTEDEGQTLGVFPISQQLRYAMPFDDPQKTIDILREKATEDGQHVVVMADDGEKFGIWPGTYTTVYEEKWLQRFFTLLTENQDWLHTTTFKSYYTTHQPRGLIYLPTASYFEMSQWTLPTSLGQDLEKFVHQLHNAGEEEFARPFVKGGIWRNFLSKYTESNWMQKRVQDLSDRITNLETSMVGPLPSEVKDDLYRAECNCGFWHGVFGGLYLPHLRHAIFEHLLKAEQALNKVSHEPMRIVDIDKDGLPEYQLRNTMLQVFIRENGAAIQELDVVPVHFNVLNTLTRYSESYHHKLSQATTAANAGGSIHDLVLAKEENLQDALFIDKYPRMSWIDHFFGEDESLERYFRSETVEGGSFLNTRFHVDRIKDGIRLTATGFIWKLPVTLQKTVTMSDQGLRFEIAIKNTSEHAIRGFYGNEFNFGLLGGNSPDRYYELNGDADTRCTLNTKAENEGVREVRVASEWDNFAIALEFLDPVRLWRAPVETVSMSEAGFERVYQASGVLPLWHFDLAPGKSQKISFSLTVETPLNS